MGLLADVLENMSFLPYLSFGPFIPYATFFPLNIKKLSLKFILSKNITSSRFGKKQCPLPENKQNEVSLDTGTDFVIFLGFHVKDTVQNIFVYGKCMARDFSNFI